MRVLIDTTYAARAPHSGTAIYLDRVIDALSRLGVEVVTAANERRRAPAGGGIGSVRNLLADRAWTAAQLPSRARETGVDVIHHPLPAFAGGGRTPPQVITVHDLAFERLPEHFDSRFRSYAHRAHRSAARRAGAVICVSETTAADVRELWEVPSERIVVARHGPGQSLPAVSPGAPEHFLYVGDDEPRKNVALLLAAYRSYREATDRPLELVLAGSAAADAPGVRVEREPDRERLARLYARAVALVHPSLYEGFGLTALEAMGLGTPVVAADVPGVREICGEAARYADPRDPQSFARAMAKIAADPALRTELGRVGIQRAAQFSWADSARAHLDAYSLAIERA